MIINYGKNIYIENHIFPETVVVMRAKSLKKQYYFKIKLYVFF